MDDRRFDSLARSLASGSSRRSILKGLLGLGGAALVGTAALEDDADAARRPTPTPTPVRCPGQQTAQSGQCVCLAPPAPGTQKCGPDCCNPTGSGPAHSECCDNACCFGTCYGEELCCATNERPGGLSPTNRICNGPDGPRCCEHDQHCCLIDGCCDTVCWGGSVGDSFCCSESNLCPGGTESEDVCCIDNTTCCGGGTNANACVDLGVAGNCCDDGDCDDSCQICSQQSHTCGPLCDAATEVCCTGLHSICVTGECCPGTPCTITADGGDPVTGLCCPTSDGTICIAGETCPAQCSEGNPCPGCASCVRGLCVGGCVEGEICCDEECLSSSEFFSCAADSAGCCGVADACCNVDGCCAGACYGGDSGRDLCCNRGTEVYCLDAAGVAECCPDAVNQKCCGTVGCCGNSQCNEEANICCDDSQFACGAGEDACCDTETQKCCDGVCIDASECCPSTDGNCGPACAPNCDCSDPANDGLDCNGGLAAGGGVCACGYCVVPLDGCPCGCAGDTECVRCAGGGVCETYNQSGACNGGAGVCAGEWCVDPPTDLCEGVTCAECNVCDPTNGTCVADASQNGIACATGVCASGTCTCITTGSLVPCGGDGQCCSGLCHNSACVPCKPEGGGCDADLDCCSGYYCSGSRCTVV